MSPCCHSCATALTGLCRTPHSVFIKRPADRTHHLAANIRKHANFLLMYVKTLIHMALTVLQVDQEGSTWRGRSWRGPGGPPWMPTCSHPAESSTAPAALCSPAHTHDIHIRCVTANCVVTVSGHLLAPPDVCCCQSFSAHCYDNMHQLRSCSPAVLAVKVMICYMTGLNPQP